MIPGGPDLREAHCTRWAPEPMVGLARRALGGAHGRDFEGGAALASLFEIY